MVSKNFDQRVCKEVSDRIKQLISETILKEFGYEVRTAGGNFNENSYKLKIEIVKPISAVAKKFSSLKSTEGELKNGWALPGTEIMFKNVKYFIVKAKRTNYSIEDSSGKRFLLRFGAATLA